MIEQQIYKELKKNMIEYDNDYSGFIARSERIEEREYWNQCREEEEFEILNNYGVI